MATSPSPERPNVLWICTDQQLSKEPSLSPDKLSVASYKRKISRLGPHDPGGESLVGTPWAQAWHDA